MKLPRGETSARRHTDPEGQKDPLTDHAIRRVTKAPLDRWSHHVGRGVRFWPLAKVFISVAVHVGFFTCIAIVVWSRRTVALAGEDAVPTEARRLYRFYLIASSFAGFFYIVMMVEAAACDTYRHLRSFRADLPADDYLERVCAEKLKLSWYAHSFHYEMRTQTRLRRNAMGEVNVRPVPRTHEKIITHRQREPVPFRRCRDVTHVGKSALRSSVVRIECSKVFSFKDQRSRDYYNKTYSTFCMRTNGKDEFTDHGEDFEIPGYLESVMAPTRARPAPCWLSEVWFWLLTMLLLTWPYRWLFCALIPRLQVVFVKELEF